MEDAGSILLATSVKYRSRATKFSSLRRKPHKPLLKVFLILTNLKRTVIGHCVTRSRVAGRGWSGQIGKACEGFFTPTGRCLSFMPKAMMAGTAKEGYVWWRER